MALATNLLKIKTVNSFAQWHLSKIKSLSHLTIDSTTSKPISKDVALIIKAAQ